MMSDYPIQTRRKNRNNCICVICQYDRFYQKIRQNLKLVCVMRSDIKFIIHIFFFIQELNHTDKFKLETSAIEIK